MVYAYNHDALEITARRIGSAKLDNPAIVTYLVRKCGALVECVTLRKVFQDRIRQARRAATCPDRFGARMKEAKPCIR